MYRFPPPQREIIAKWSPSQRFWLQSWFELLHEFSASVFRVRPIPLSAVAAELVDVIGLWKGGSVTSAAADDVRKELLHIVRDDPLLPTEWPRERTSFLSALGSGLTADSDVSLLVWCATQLCRERFVSAYRARLIEVLRSLVNDGGTPQFAKIRAVSERLIAELLWSGYSETRLFRRAMGTLRADADPTAAISDALGSFGGATREYECRFRLDGFHGGTVPREFDYAGVQFRQPTPPAGADERIVRQFERRRIATVRVTALDPFAAPDFAGIVLRRAVDALVFTLPLQSPQIHGEVEVQQGSEQRRIDILDTAVFGLLPSSADRFRRFQGLFRGIATADESLDALDAIHIALHWYTAALGSAALDLERTFLSLWIGLEYLIAGHGRVAYSEHGGIIVPIKRYLPRVTALYMPSLLLRDLTNYLYRLAEEGDLEPRDSLAGRLPGPGAWFDEAKLLECLADKQWVSDLLTQRDGDELLRERIVWMQGQFTSADSVLNAMRGHVGQSERDIAHIYRVRNNIAHGGAFGRRLPLLRYGIRIAHDYLKTLIENLLFHVGREHALGMSDVLMSSETTYNGFQNAKSGSIGVGDIVGARAMFIEMR